MSGSPAVLMRLVASCYTVSERAGAIVRKVLHSGELGIVEKVGIEFKSKAEMQIAADVLLI